MHKQIGSDIRHMTQSIQGLVMVANVEMLWQHREKLEEVLQSLDSTILDYELKLVKDKLPFSQWSIFEKALQKKQKV